MPLPSLLRALSDPMIRRRGAATAATCVVLLGLGLGGPVHGQRYPVRTFTEQDGLRSSTVYALTQDREGRMWFITRAGVVIYDGFEWSASPSNQVPPFEGYELLETDQAGGAWLASVQADRPLLRLDRSGAVVEAVASPFDPTEAGTRVSRLAVAGSEDDPVVAVGTWESGLRLLRGGRWETVTSAQGELSFPVYALATAGDRVFVGTDSGVAELRGDRLDGALGVRLPAEAREVRALAWDDSAPTNTLWLVGRNWVGKIEDGQFRTLARAVPIPMNPDHDDLVAEPDGLGGLYFGSEIGLFHLDGASGAVAPLGRRNGLGADGATDLLLDRERNLWISSPRGVSRIPSLRFAIYDSTQGLLEDEVTAILERSPGELVLGHNMGLSILREGKVVATHRLSHPDLEDEQLGRVQDLAQDDQGNLWAAMGHFGLARIAPDGSVRWTGGGIRTENRVDVVWIDDRGRVTVGTGDGLARLERGELVRFRPPGLGRTRTRKVERGPGGKRFLATPGNGLFIESDGRWRHVTSPGPEEENYLFTVLPDRQGRVWVGSVAGLLLLDGGVLRKPDEQGLRIDRPVYLLVEDSDGSLWVGTDYGVYRWDGSTLDHFTGRDGLPGNEANRDAGLVDSAGRLWIGTDRGVSLVRYQGGRRLRPPPEVALAALELDGESVSPLESRELGYRDDRLGFLVRAVSFVDERQIEYRTRLQGHETGWTVQDGTTRLESRYSALAPGTYTFQVQARSDRSGWSPIVSSAPVTIRPPFWRTGWFLGGALLLLAAVGYSGQRFHSQRVYARQLEEEVALRTAELATSRSRIESERVRLARTLESVADGLAATDTEGRVILWNRAAEEITGWSAEAAVGRPLGDVLSLEPETGSAAGGGSFEVVLDAILDHGERAGSPASFRLTDRSRRERQVELTGAPTGGATGSRGAVVAFRDVTERRRLEAELLKAQKLESRGGLAGGIAHDFNNLLTVMLGYLSLVQASPRVGSDETEHLEQAARALGRAQELSRQLLTFSHGGAPVTGSVAVAEVVRESAEFTSRGSNVRLDLALTEDLWDAEADEGQISQVLNNLLINALQAMPDGGAVTITGGNAELEEDEVPGLPSGRYVHLRVADRGCGIPPETLPRIFDPFFTTKDAGSGLGLTTAYSIVRQHGGAVTVESEPGEGARFDLWLPACRRSADAGATAPSVDGTAGGRVLVMDDQPPVRAVLEGMLRHLGWEAAGARHGDEAVAMYREARERGEPYDLVILDLTVPGGKGGKETLRELLRIDPAVRAVASSGYADDPVLLAGRGEGFVDALPKPYRLADLGQLLARIGHPREEADRSAGRSA